MFDIKKVCYTKYYFCVGIGKTDFYLLFSVQIKLTKHNNKFSNYNYYRSGPSTLSARVIQVNLTGNVLTY